MGSTPIGISASRGAAVLGLSPYQTPLDVWSQLVEERKPGTLARLGITLPERPDNAAIRWGTAFEDSVCSLAEQACGFKIRDRERLCVIADGEVPITCHLDGLYEDGTIHEGKTTSAFAFRESWGEPGTDHVPQSYQVQVQHQMLCAGADSAIVSVLVFPCRPEEWEELGLRVKRDEDADSWHVINENGIIVNSCETWAFLLANMGFFHQYPVSANHELQAQMVEKYTEFWMRYVVTEMSPPAESWSDVKRLFPAPRGTVVATEEQERLAATYAQIGKELTSSKKSQDAIRGQLMGAIERGAEYPIDSDSVEAIVLRSRDGRKIASYAKEKSGKLVFRCGG